MATNNFYSPPGDGRLEVSDDGGSNYHRIFALTDFTASGGARNETTTEVLDDDVDPVTSVGPASGKDVSVTVNGNAGTRGAQIVRSGYSDRKRITARYTTKADRIELNANTGVTLAVAPTTGRTWRATVTGVGTMFATDTKWQRGRGVVFGTGAQRVLRIIEEITDETHMVVVSTDGSAIAQQSANDDWELWDHGERFTFEAEVLNANNVSLSPGSPKTDTYDLKTVGVMPDPTFVFTTP